jgi:transcriptional regulator with XRE-family HTH domain
MMTFLWLVVSEAGRNYVAMARRRDSELQEALGARLRHVRTRRGWTQERLADAVGVRTASISRFENGLVGFSLTTLAQVADVLRVPIAELVDIDRPVAPLSDGDEALARLHALPAPVRARAARLALALVHGADDDPDLRAWLHSPASDAYVWVPVG